MMLQTICRIAICCAIVLLSVLPTAQASDGQAGHKVDRLLIIYSYDANFSWTRRISPQLHEALSAPGRTIIEEFLDTKRFPAEEAFQITHETLKAKIEKYGAPDLVLTFDDNAIIFADRFRESLFAETPVIFVGVNSMDRVREMAGKPFTTGVFESLSIGENIDLAVTLNGVPLERVVAVIDDTETSKAIFSDIRKGMEKYPDIALDTIDVSTMTFEEALEETARITDPATAILYGGNYRDKNGVARSSEETAYEFGKAARRPYYSILDTSVDAGATAGVVISAAAIAGTAIDYVNRYLSGTPVDSIPPLFKSPNVTMIDEPRARSFGLQLENLPEGTVVLRPVPPFVERYQNALIAAGLVLAGMGVIMLSLHIASLRIQRGLKVMNIELTNKNREISRAKSEIEYQSLHDRLTDLPNRLHVEKKIAEILDRPHRTSAWALFHIDIEDFQEMNDTLGHEAGDSILIAAGNRLRNLVPEEGLVARTGCDEFAVLIPWDSFEQAQAFGDSLAASLKVAVSINGASRWMVVRSGFSVIGTGEKVSVREVVRRSDVALYRAKSIRSTLCVPFVAAYDEAYKERRQIADEIVSGLQNGEFVPYFQPQISTEDGRIIGFEALVRWQHPERGMLPPVSFLPVAEKIGVVADIDRMVLEKAAECVSDWRAKGFEPEHISVNVSADRLYDEKLVSSVRGIDLGETRLCFEILESIFLDDADSELDRTLELLHGLGISVEVDDFGTGHASILGLSRVKPARLKIAREIIMPLCSDDRQKGIISGIVQMGRSMGIALTAEGVETLDQARLLKELGLDVLQGYYFSRPMSAEATLDFISTTRHMKFAA